MRIAGTAALLALALLPALADARPITAGASIGRIQSEVNADGEASDTYQLFGRIGFTSRLSAQIELQKIEDPYADVRSFTGLLVVELAGSQSRLMPLLVAGLGVDSAKTDYSEAHGTHKEGGLGLEYRADGGFTIGADVRLGGRSVDQSDQVVPLGEGMIGLWAPAMAEGEYRSARLYAAIRF
jgi:hypothetical protein